MKKNFLRLHKKNQKEKGAMLVAVLLIMIMVFGIIYSVFLRISTDVQTVTVATRGQAAYQRADQNIERVLNVLREADTPGNTVSGNGDGTTYDTNKKIPENIYAVEVCDCNTSESTCPQNDKIGCNVPQTDFLSNITSIKTQTEVGGVKRSIETAVQPRVAGIDNNFTVEVCSYDGGDTCNFTSASPELGLSDGTTPLTFKSQNLCDVKLTFDYDRNYDLSDPKKNGNGFEVRVATGSGVTLNNRLTDWNFLKKDSANLIYTIGEGVAGNAGKNGLGLDYVILNNNFEYNKTYYFTVKVKNKDPFMLGSYHAAVQKFTTPADNDLCTVTAGGTCKESAGVGESEFAGDYACCGGSSNARLKCYVPTAP